MLDELCYMRADAYRRARPRESGPWLRLTERLLSVGDIRIAAVIAATGLWVDFGVGQNWGPPDREMFVALPFLVYCLLRLTFWLADTDRRRRAVFALLLVLVGYRAIATTRRLHRPSAPIYMPGITVNTIGSLVPPVERMRDAARLAVLLLAAPDVGGVMLFGEHLRVIDLGMLCDRRLAHTGYTGASQYILDERRPRSHRDPHLLDPSDQGRKFAGAL